MENKKFDILSKTCTYNFLSATPPEFPKSKHKAMENILN